MLDFLFKKEVSAIERLNDFYDKLKELYPFSSISDERKDYLKSTMAKFGYLPYPHIKALEELSDAEVLWALESKWENEGVFADGKFIDTEVSPLARNNVKDSSWLQKEGHDIKLVNLAALGNGNESDECGKFMSWLRQLLILPTGNIENNIFSTTIYLIPFHPREFGCAYLPTASCVSPGLEDKNITDKTGLDADEQVKMFIKLSQLAGHPVIYDILPRTGRFSKLVLTNPECARWFDINALMDELCKNVDTIAETFKEKYSADDLEIVSGIYKKAVRGEGYGDLTEHYQNIFDDFDENLKETTIFLSNSMLERSIQDKLHKKAKNIINRVSGNTYGKKMSENDIKNQGEIIQTLISEGMWPAPGGAWCSAGVPVFDKMSEGASYPMFKHYKFNGEDVTHFANLDCQTPFYFVCLENGKYNNDVIKLFTDYMKNLQKDYGFDGFRVDHIDHVVDEVSEQNGRPISYRAPKYVLNKLNTTMKKKLPYFATLAEYMLWDNYYKEYHEDMNFDVLWGNDIISQFDKTPEKIVDDNQNLVNYNSKFKSGNMLSILKTYNNQDGEFHAIDQYPAQLGENGALYKWAKYKLLPGGKYAQRPVMYADGDESFTQGGLEYTIGEEVAMSRNDNDDFYTKFDAIDRFVKNNAIISGGEAQIIIEDEDGYCAWMITREPLNTAYLVVSNYKYPTEKVVKTAPTGESYREIVEGYAIFDKNIAIPCDYDLKYELVLKEKDYEKEEYENSDNIHFEKLEPGEFRIFELERK